MMRMNKEQGREREEVAVTGTCNIYSRESYVTYTVESHM